MNPYPRVALAVALALEVHATAQVAPAPQAFRQEIARKFDGGDGLPKAAVRLLDGTSGDQLRAFVEGRWYERRSGTWEANRELNPGSNAEFVFSDEQGGLRRTSLPWRNVKQLLRAGRTNYVATATGVRAVAPEGTIPLPWPSGWQVNQMALSPRGELYIAANTGLVHQRGETWEKQEILDEVGRAWGARDVLGVTFDSAGRLWFASRAGVGCRSEQGWRFYEGKDGLPWNDFTWIAAGPNGEVWFATHLGVIRFDGKDWHYRQGPRWLPGDDVTQCLVDSEGRAWLATAQGLGCIERQPMTLAAKAEFYESEIERYVKRTPFGFVAEAHLRRAGDRASADPQDSDNDGLWTAMYGAGECFGYAATHDPKAKARARQAFEALRFLQKVTQECDHAPPKGYVARTIRPIEWPDPNRGRLESDRQEQANDKLWKAYEPRWPKSGDGKWYWKSDTSSDELDGHFFFYPLYYDLCAETDTERERAREVVRDLTDHLVNHEFTLVDHDGKPTRWGVYGPQYLNHDANWWQERGLKSLSILSYLAVAGHITGDPKYAAAARALIDRHGYAQNAMHPKVQQGPGSGNQSDDEMAFMCFYSLLRYSPDEELKRLIRISFYRYWANEAPEMNPFFNFAYAAHNLQAVDTRTWGAFPLKPWPGWHSDAMATLYGFPLDRLNWPHRNSHRLDLVFLTKIQSGDLAEPDAPHERGCLVNGKVLPVENRHFSHWNTDPWRLDYGGQGDELAAGTVFLLPYYMGLYHGFIELPK